MDFSTLSIAEIRSRCLPDGKELSSCLLESLLEDRRAGVRQIYQTIKRRQEKERGEQQRVFLMLRIERGLWASGVRCVAGVDEVGVGPLAGPIVAGAVIFEPGTMILGVDDSKRVRAKRRERLEQKIKDKAVGVGIGMARVEELDRLNVYNAGILAMQRAVESLPVTPGHLLVDARKISGSSIPQSSLAKGDRISFSIAAASIIAKTYRDRLMIKLGEAYPQYGFAQHKGYGTPDHMAAIERHGPSAIHRKSFAFIREFYGDRGHLFCKLKKRLLEATTIEGLRSLQDEIELMQSSFSGVKRQEIALLSAQCGARILSVSQVKHG